MPKPLFIGIMLVAAVLLVPVASAGCVDDLSQSEFDDRRSYQHRLATGTVFDYDSATATFALDTVENVSTFLSCTV
ncbi:MAG: hypothetical protein WC876_08840 [Candidatus Thermoplasmatota archaeon]|jgi:hypothetical protein